MSRQHTGNVMSSSAALQGANMAFNAHALDRETKKNNVARPQTATVPERSPLRHAVEPEPEPEPEPISEMPEAGLVMSRIKAYSGSSSLNPGQEVLGRHSPQLQAAQLAALRSSSRTPSVVHSSPSVSPIRRARTGTGYTKRDDIVLTPKPEFLSVRASNAVHAPTPVRRESTVASSPANIVDQDGLDKHLQTRESVGMHASASESDANLNEILLSKDRDLASRSQITKTKPDPPARKPNLSQLPRDTRKQPEILPRLRDEQGQRATKINPPGRKKASDTSFERETSPSHSTNTISSRPETDEIVVRRSYNPSPTRQITGNTDGSSGMTKEGLADAIIASSLASSRVPSPYNNPPPLPPPRRSRSRSGLHPGDIFKRDNRSTLSPPKRQGLRQTLRDPPKPESKDNKNPGRRNLIRHHPHKHHEGDRKRWRQEVSEAARKRYEGVWAANKGLWVPPEGVIYRMFPDLPRAVVLSDLVVHLVVRDIWSRSRLPDHTLELIWNLVDRKGIGLLSREEFVVGLWLIDEALRGHKIPVKVPDSVWASVRGLLGIKLPQEARSSRSRTTFHPKSPIPAGLVTKEPDHEPLTSDHVYFRHTE